MRTGKPRVFTRREVTVDALLASACLPQVFKAVEIDGEPYWDGGYLGNPALWPLYDQGGAARHRAGAVEPARCARNRPPAPRDIVNRLNEITFNGSLMAEMRAIDFVQRLLDTGRLEQPRYRRLFIHLIEDEDRMRKFKLSTKFNGDWDFLSTLRQYGREAADAWLAEHFDKLGRESSVDIRARFSVTRRPHAAWARARTATTRGLGAVALRAPDRGVASIRRRRRARGALRRRLAAIAPGSTAARGAVALRRSRRATEAR